MNLRSSTREQLIDIIQFVREETESESPPAPLIWGERRIALQNAALFLEAFVIPVIPPELGARHAPDGANGNGARALEVLRATGFGAQYAPATMGAEEGDRAALDDQR